MAGLTQLLPSWGLTRGRHPTSGPSTLGTAAVSACQRVQQRAAGRGCVRASAATVEGCPRLHSPPCKLSMATGCGAFLITQLGRQPAGQGHNLSACTPHQLNAGSDPESSAMPSCCFEVLTAHGPLAAALAVRQARGGGLLQAGLAPQALGQAVELGGVLGPGTGCGRRGGGACIAGRCKAV